MFDLQKTREDFASKVLVEAIQFLRAQEPSTRNTLGIISAGIASSFLLDKKLFDEFMKIWNGTPKEDYLANKQLSELVFKPLNLDEHRILSVEEFSEYLQKFARQQLEICLNKNLNFDEILQMGKSQLEIEELGCTYAVIEEYDKAREISEYPNLADFRRDGILWTIEVEKLRRGDFSTSDISHILRLNSWGAHPSIASQVALCALGRIPFLGYPFPDW